MFDVFTCSNIFCRLHMYVARVWTEEELKAASKTANLQTWNGLS